SFGRPLPVNPCTAIRPTDELSQAFGARTSNLLRVRNLECAIRVRSTKEARQVRQRVSFIAGGIELERVSQGHGLHTACIANAKEKKPSPQDARTREQPSMAFGQPLRLRACGLRWLPTVADQPLTATLRPALLGASDCPRGLRRHAG